MSKADKDKHTCVRAARKLLGLTQPEMASATGLGQKTVARAEQLDGRGKGKVSEDTVGILVAYFSSQLGKLFELVDIPEDDLPKSSKDFFRSTDFFEAVDGEDNAYLPKPGPSGNDERKATIRAICRNALRRVKDRSAT